MKALFGLLFFVPLVLFANDAPQDKTYAQFQHLCLHGKTIAKREMYCQLAKEHRKAMGIVDDFSQKKSS
jgi:hypothetical protein